MTPYWRLFLNALDDFMLKFLSVCAVVQLVIEVSFADASHRSTCKFNIKSQKRVYLKLQNINVMSKT